MAPPIEMNRFAELKATGELPSPRGVALAIIRMTQDEEVSTAELARVIKGDPAFVGRLIKAANGLIGRQRRTVVSVQDALMVLGMPAVRTMALGFSLLSSYRKGSCAGFDYTRFWSSSLLMALSMQVLAQRIRGVAVDEAFSVGLLARVGELALASIYPAEFSRLLAEVQRAPDLRLLDLEQKSLAITHRDLGAAMLADWGLPQVFSEPVRFFEQPDKATFAEDSRESLVMQSLVLARSIAEICLAPEAEQAALMGMVLKIAQRLGYTREAFVDTCVGVAQQWVEWGKLLHLETPSPPRFANLCPDAAVTGESPAAATEAEGSNSDGDIAAVPGVATSGLRILVIDDQAADRALLRDLLAGAGHQVFETAGGGQVIEQTLEIQPHMLVLDCRTGGPACCSLVRSLRATRLGRSMYILLLTATDDEELLIQMFEAGADDFVAKPIKSRVFAARLNAGQRIVRLQQELERDREEVRHFAAELAISNRRLQEAALTDALTGFPNRRYAMNRMQQEWTASSRSRRPLSCMVIDIDGFKQINDTHGHDVGDMVLRQTSDTLRSALRGQDVICRTGGDEFLVICPETDMASTLLCAERLRAAVDGMVITTGGPTLDLTISVGVATRDDAMADLDGLIKQADRAAYLAKRRGRNCVASVQGEHARDLTI